MWHSPSRFDVSSVNVFSNVNVLTSSFLVARLCPVSRVLKVSAGLTDVSSLAVAAFDFVYCSLSVLRFVSFLDVSK